MIAGRLTEYVTLQKPVVTRDAFGAETTTYVDTVKVHADVQWKSGSTSVSDSEVYSGERLEVLIRDAHTVSTKWRLTYQETSYFIIALEHVRLRGYFKLVCDKVNE